MGEITYTRTSDNKTYKNILDNKIYTINKPEDIRFVRATRVKGKDGKWSSTASYREDSCNGYETLIYKYAKKYKEGFFMHHEHHHIVYDVKSNEGRLLKMQMIVEENK